MTTFRKILNAAGSFISGIITFPFAVGYHHAKPFFQLAVDEKSSSRLRVISGIVAVFAAVYGFIGGVFFGVSCLGALVGGGVASKVGYEQGFVAGLKEPFKDGFLSKIEKLYQCFFACLICQKPINAPVARTRNASTDSTTVTPTRRSSTQSSDSVIKASMPPDLASASTSVQTVAPVSVVVIVPAPGAPPRKPLEYESFPRSSRKLSK